MMTDSASSLPTFTDADLPDRVSHADVEKNRFTEAALVRHKREGLELAVRSRWIALAVIGALLPFLNPDWDVLYYEAMLLAMAGMGWLQSRVGRVGRSSSELIVLFFDLALMTFVLVFPNPFSENDWPTAMGYRFENFIYLFVILGAGTLAYSWRTITAIGNWTAAMWLIAAVLVWWFGHTDPELGAAALAAFGHDPDLAAMFDPNSVAFDRRIQEVVVFLIVAFTLAVGVRRFNRLLLGNAALERERANLSRYFSPNVVDELSHKDEPLKQIRAHEVAVMFVDIVDFTSFAAERSPQDLIETLRGFHGRMESEVFRHGGTLDKYLGDGLMATFGTPTPGPMDASNALTCARAMIRAMELWNAERATQGLPVIRVSFGLHYGSVVLGDIGATQLEFAVIGNTVNVASRLEALSRTLAARLVLSGDLRDRVCVESGAAAPMLAQLERCEDQTIRGIDGRMVVWMMV